MKIGPFTIGRTKSISEKYKAAYDKTGTAKPKRKTYHPGENTWRERCKHYDQLWEDYPLFRQAVTSLAGLVNPQGIFFKPAVKKNEETYALAEEALYRCEQFRDTRFVNGKIYNTAWNLGKYGSCFWELTQTPIFDFRIPPMQEYIEVAETDDQGTVTKWRQYVHGQTQAEWTSEELVILSWNATTKTWPYGNGIGVGLETEMESLVDFETASKDYMEKQAWPYEILKLGDQGTTVGDTEYNSAKSQWKTRQPGEGIVTRNMPVDIIPGGTNSSPIRELAALCSLLKDNIHDGFIVPPLSKLYNSTEASAKVLTAHVMTVLGQPLQWLIGEALQTYVLKPYLETSGFSRKSCPTILFESPDTAKSEEAEFWKAMGELKVQTPKQIADHLGLEYDDDYWKQEEQKQQEQMMAGKALPDKQNAAEPQKGEEVWEVRRKGVKKNI